MNANPLCDLTPVFKDYEKYLAGIEQQLGDSAGSDPVREPSKMSLDAQSPALFGSTKLQQESPFLFPGDRREEGPPEKKTEAVPEHKVDLSPGATSASFNFGKKVDGSVFRLLNSGPLAGFSLPSGNSSLFGKDTAQSKPVSSPFSIQTVEKPADGGSADCKGKRQAGPESPWVCASPVPGVGGGGGQCHAVTFELGQVDEPLHFVLFLNFYLLI